MPPATIGSPNRPNSRRLPLANRAISRHTGNMRNPWPPILLSGPGVWPGSRPTPSGVSAMTANRIRSRPVTLVTLVTLVTVMQIAPAAVTPVTLRERGAAEPRPATSATKFPIPAPTFQARATTFQPPMILPPRRHSVYGWPVGYQPPIPGTSRPPIPGIKMSSRRLRSGVDWWHARPHA